MGAVILRGDATHLPLANESVDSIVCDPPYGLEFMGREWDAPWRAGINADAGFSPVGFDETGRRLPRATEMLAFQEWCATWAAECLRVLKPGGYLLAFGGTRTYHRLTCAIEDAGFEIRDSLHWLHGSGFPKSLNVSKAIDKAADAEREIAGSSPYAAKRTGAGNTGDLYRQRASSFESDDRGTCVTAPATEDAARWEGWGTALKPAHEPVAVARKPLNGTVARNVLEHGTGALNIDACRAGGDGRASGGVSQAAPGKSAYGERSQPEGRSRPEGGRWPANILLSHTPGCEMTGTREVRSDGHHPAVRGPGGYSGGWNGQEGLAERKSGTETVESWSCADSCPVAELDRQGGGASRFFPVFRYQAKAPASERPRLEDGTAWPTVKPVELMRWLVRLVTPPGGTVLDPFCGTGTTGEAAILEGFDAVLIDKDPDALALTRVRLAKPVQPGLFGLEAS
jgi:hypothetical protein